MPCGVTNLIKVIMLATGTDNKPLEILFFLRAVKSRVLYEQMLGRVTQVISAKDLQVVSSGARGKERYVIVDAVGLIDNPKFATPTLGRKRTVPIAQLFQSVATGRVRRRHAAVAGEPLCQASA